MEQQGPTPPGVTGYQIDDLVIDLGQQRVTRGTSDIALLCLSLDLVVTLARSAPNFVSFDQLTERVWPGLVIAPETIRLEFEDRSANGSAAQRTALPGHWGGLRFPD